MTSLFLRTTIASVAIASAIACAVVATIVGWSTPVEIQSEPVEFTYSDPCCLRRPDRVTPGPVVIDPILTVVEYPIEIVQCTPERVSHRRARRILDRALTEALGRNATLAELQAVQAVAWLESRYGAAWTGEGCGSHNWGAIHAPCDSGTFSATDSALDTGEQYQACFRRYGSAEAGAKGLVWELVRRDAVLIAVASGDLARVVEALRDTEYCHASAATYRSGMDRALRAITRALDEPIAFEDALP
jgi:hypothetical protein